MKLTFALRFLPLIAALITSYNCYSSLFAANAKFKSDSKRGAQPAHHAKSPLQDVHEKYRDVKTLTAEFSQKQINIALGSTKESKGRISIRRPNSFRWETLEPAKEISILVSNGKKVWFYKPPFRETENGQVLIRNAADVNSQLAIDLMSGRSNTEKDFKFKELAPGRLELIPLKPAGDIERIELFIESPTKLVYKLLLFTLTGNQTELTLKNVELNPKIPDSLFIFKAPPKTEEIY